MKSPRLLFFLIILLTIFAIYINLQELLVVSRNKKIPQYLLHPFGVNRDLSFRKGLDLQGGTSITFKADMSGVKPEARADALVSAKSIMETRINLFGVSEPVVQTAATNNDYRIIVELPGVTDVNQAIALIGTTAELSFWEPGASSSAALSKGSLTTPSPIVIKDNGKPITAEDIKKAAVSGSYPTGTVEALGDNPKKTDLTGSDLQQTSVTFDPNTGKPQVQLNFTPDGAKKFAEITKRNVNKVVAIVLDNQVIEAPRVNQAILTGNAVITGGFTPETAKALSTELNAGALPVSLSILEQHVIGPTLGTESLQKTLFAGILGFVIIIVFMCVLYGNLGIMASIALFIYTLVNLSIFKLSALTPYGITLTLSGIAGFILSIGMAVDANILIFERIKEELRRGRSKELATELGFSRAWQSIKDSNISTIITSIILYMFGTGLVKGFALVLAIGVLISMFSAIIVTRTFVRIIYSKKL